MKIDLFRAITFEAVFVVKAGCDLKRSMCIKTPFTSWLIAGSLLKMSSRKLRNVFNSLSCMLLIATVWLIINFPLILFRTLYCPILPWSSRSSYSPSSWAVSENLNSDLHHLPSNTERRHKACFAGATHHRRQCKTWQCWVCVIKSITGGVIISASVLTLVVSMRDAAQGAVLKIENLYDFCIWHGFPRGVHFTAKLGQAYGLVPFLMSMFFHRSILSPTRVQLNLDLSIWSQIKIFPSSNFRCNSVGLFIYLFRLKTTGQNLTTDNNYPPICTTWFPECVPLFKAVHNTNPWKLSKYV